MNSERRLHPVAMLIGAIKTIRRWISGLVFPGIALLVTQGFSLRTVTLFLLGILVVSVLAALWGFLSWRATTYMVTGNSFRLRQGVIQKSERTIPLEHVQSVDTVQGIIQRFFAVGSQFLDDFLSDDFVRRLVENLMPNWLMVFLILIPVGLLVAWLLAIAGTVLAYNGFTLSREGNFLYIKRGLLERREATIPLS